MPDSILVVDGYGSRRVHVVWLAHGMKVIASEEAGRHHRAFHPRLRTSSSFSMTIQHMSYEAYRDFNEWLKVYADRISSADNTLPPMRIIVPAVRFDRMGIPSGGIMFGRSYDEYYWKQTLDIKGASDLINLNAADLSEISQAFASTYFEEGGAAGDYATSYAIARLSEAILAGGRFEDALYAPKVPSIPPPTESNPRKEFYDGLTRHLREGGGG